MDAREDHERAFKESPACRFMVATPDAGGRGRTWDAADLVIYYSQRNNLDHRLQSEDRAKNVGKARPVAYVDMRVPGTVEDVIINALRSKMDLSALVEGTDPLRWLV
jgi:SNF2 family DNA or RNA helicase